MLSQYGRCTKACGHFLCEHLPLPHLSAHDFAGAFTADSSAGGSGCAADGTEPLGRANNSISLRGPAPNYCRLANATVLVPSGGGGSSTPIDFGDSAASRQSAARAVRITVDHAAVFVRTVRVFLSPDASFDNLVEVLTLLAPSALRAATGVTIGLGGVSVSQFHQPSLFFSRFQARYRNRCSPNSVACRCILTL